MTSEQLDLFPTEESSPQDGPVRTSPWRDVVRAWLAHAADCGGKSCGSWLKSSPVGSSVRTSLASCHRSANAPETKAVSPMAGQRNVENGRRSSPTPIQAAGDSAPSSDPAKSGSLTSTTRPTVDLAPVDAWKHTVGQWVPSSGRWQTSGMGSPTECWTLNTSEFPSSVVESSLSDILEPPSERLRRYFLSPKAATGILRRAGRRGRALPAPLQAALQRLAGGGVAPTLTSTYAKSNFRGDGIDALILEDTHTHTHNNFDTAGRRETRVSDRCRIRSGRASHRGAVAALTSNGVGTCGPDDNQAQAGHLVVHPLALRGREGGAMLEIGPEGGPYNALRAGDGGSSRQSLVCITGQVTHTLTSEGADASEDGTGRGTPIVAAPTVAATLTSGTAASPGVNRPGRRREDDHNLVGMSRGTIVRRLTELECERLQGYPDGWTGGQSGSARYRQLGNSVAVPVVEWIAHRLMAVDGEVGA